MSAYGSQTRTQAIPAPATSTHVPATSLRSTLRVGRACGQARLSWISAGMPANANTAATDDTTPGAPIAPVVAAATNAPATIRISIAGPWGPATAASATPLRSSPRVRAATRTTEPGGSATPPRANDVPGSASRAPAAATASTNPWIAQRGIGPVWQPVDVWNTGLHAPAVGEAPNGVGRGVAETAIRGRSSR